MYRLDKAGHEQTRPIDGRRSSASPPGSLLNQLANEDPDFLRRPKTRSPLAPQAPSTTEHHDVRSDASRTLPTARISEALPGLRYIGDIGVDDVLIWLRDGLRWIVLAIVVCVAAALCYAYITPPRYTSYTDIVINPSNLNVVDDSIVSTSQQRDTQILEVESKLRTITSRNVLARVVDELKLDEDSEFITPPPIARLKAIFSSDVGKVDNKTGALRALADKVKAERDPRSFVVTLSVWTNAAEKSVTISKAIVRAFESELFQTEADSSQRVLNDMKAQLEKMRQDVSLAEQRVADFRRERGLQQNNGQLVSDQASGELNMQVLAAQQRLIQEESRLKQMEEAIAQNLILSAAIFESQTMNRIRAQYSTLQQQIGAMTLTYGARHPRLAAAEAERSALTQAIVEEARRILQAAKINVAEAQSSLDGLRLKAVAERSNVFTDNEAQVRLRELERDAQSAAAIYQTYLTRSRQIAQQQTIDSTNVRVISEPITANAKSWPPGKALLAVAGGMSGIFLGILIATALGLFRYLRREDHPQAVAAYT